MSSFESWLISFWPALLALSCSLMLVLLLRWPTRRWLGAESAFYLWLLPPLALLVSVLPLCTRHAQNAVRNRGVAGGLRLAIQSPCRGAYCDVEA